MQQQSVILLFFILILTITSGQVQLPRLVRNSMVLQRDAKINIGEWAASGEKVIVRLNGKAAKATACADGKWSLQFMKYKVLFFLTVTLTCYLSNAQTGTPWNGKKCAVVLTYDDALNVHLDNAIPLLDSLKLKATFYLSGYFPGCRQRLADWKKAAAKGYELGNHTLFHPCIGNTPGLEWVKKDDDLSTYTVQRMVDETRMNNVLLEALDGKKKRTFAYTCGDMKIGDSSFINNLKNDFVAARAVRSQMHPMNQVELYDVDCYAINGETGEQLIALVKKAMESNALLVFLFHGVGGEHSLNVSLLAHRQPLYFLQQNQNNIWIAPVIEVAAYVQNNQHKQ